MVDISGADFRADITDTGSGGVVFCRETGVDISGVDFTVDVTDGGGGGIDFVEKQV